MEVGVTTELAGEQACISVWNLVSGVRLKTYKNCLCARNGLDFINNNFVISAQNDKQLIHIYDTQNERLVKRIVCPGKISALTVSPDGAFCIVALQDKIYIWQISTGNLTNVLSKHYQNVTCLRFTSDGSFFISGGEDNMVIVWNFANCLQPRDQFANQDLCDQPLHVLMLHSMPLEDIHVGINGMRSSVVTCSLDQTCVLFDLCTGKTICRFILDVACTSVAMDPVERFVLVGTDDGDMYSIMSHKVKRSNLDIHVERSRENFWKAHNKSVDAISITADGTKALSGSSDCTVKLWSIINQQCLKVFDFKGEISNVRVVMHDLVFQQRDSLCKMKPSIGNFKRTVFVPGNFDQVVSPYEVDGEETLVPFVLKDIQNELPRDGYILPKGGNKASLLNDNDIIIDNIISTCHSAAKKSFNYLEPKSATRSELLEGLLSLEGMTKELHTFTVEKLLKDAETDESESGGLECK